MRKYRCFTSQENVSQELQINKLKPAWLLEVLFISFALLTNTIETSRVPDLGTGMRAKVVIVGAGVSGIAAANKLIQNGITDVTILEAMDRIGGRIYYKQLGGDFGGVDLGGHWVNGQGNNIIYELAEPLGLVNHSGDFSNQVFFRSDGVQVDLPKTLFDLYNKISKEAADYKIGKTYADLVKEEVVRFGRENNISEEDTKALIGHIKLFLCLLEGCQDIADVSLRTANVFQKSEGDWLIEWKTGGMSNILHLLMGTHEKSPWKGLGVDKKVKLSSRVAKIDWSSQDSVSIITESGSSHSADFVIVTSSLNVLKKKHKFMFTPSLPQQKINAIEALGMDAADKVYLVYRKPWWPKDVTTFNLLHSKEFTSETQDLGEAIIALGAENHNPHVLGVWFIGRGAKAMESKTEDEVQAVIMKTLKQYLGKKYTITEPDMMVRSCWWNTEDVAGAYTYDSIASEKLDNPRGILAEPLSNNHGKPMVLFAGEATNRIHFSTVHGALETGWREAERIIQYLRNNYN